MVFGTQRPAPGGSYVDRVTQETTRAETVGPTAPGARALGPDLARGFMLLFIALANTHYFLRAPEVLGGYPQGGSAVDSGVAWLLATFVDGRAFPMFGLLFGYGVAQIARRQEARRPKGVRRLLWRRAAVLVVVGLVDALLFYVGDILAAYGVLLLVGAWMVRWRDRWLLAVVGLLVVLGALPSGDSLSISPDGPDASMLPPDLWSGVVERLPVALFIAGLGPLGFLAPFAIGLWAGRRRILERPLEHLALLRVTAVVGIGAAVLGAQPVALMVAGVATPDAVTLIGPLHDTTGLLGGLGYAALISLVAARRPGGPITEALAATGQRSMTCYLMQSPVWALVFTPYLLDLSGTLTVATTALLATTTWLLTVVAADRMRRAGRRGPFEVLIRRVTYGGGSAMADRARPTYRS